MHATDFDTLLPQAKRAGFIATTLAATIAGSFGWTIGAGLVEKVCFAVGLGLASFIVGYGLVFAYHAWKRQLYGVAAAAVALFAVAVSVEFLSHVGFTASHRTANVQQAALQTTAYTDQRQVIADLERELARLEAKHDWQKSMDSPESYDAKLAAMEGDLIWKRTKSCTDATLPESREFCARYGSLKAERAIAHDRMVVAEEIKVTKQRLAEAREKSSATKVGHSTVANQGIVLASLLSGELNPDEETQTWTNYGISALLALFFITAGLLNFVAYAFDISVNGAVKQAARVILPEPKEAAPSVSERVVERQPTIVNVKGPDIMDLLRASAERAGGHLAAA